MNQERTKKLKKKFWENAVRTVLELSDKDPLPDFSKMWQEIPKCLLDASAMDSKVPFNKECTYGEFLLPNPKELYDIVTRLTGMQHHDLMKEVDPFGIGMKTVMSLLGRKKVIKFLTNIYVTCYNGEMLIVTQCPPKEDSKRATVDVAPITRHVLYHILLEEWKNLGPAWEEVAEYMYYSYLLFCRGTTATAITKFNRSAVVSADGKHIMLKCDYIAVLDKKALKIYPARRFIDSKVIVDGKIERSTNWTEFHMIVDNSEDHWGAGMRLTPEIYKMLETFQKDYQSRSGVDCGDATVEEIKVFLQ